MKRTVWGEVEHTYMEGYEDIQGEGDHLQATMEAWNSPSLAALRGDQLCRHLDLGCLASRIVR